jgi:hypothetical protein
MSQSSDLTKIRGLVARARARIRTQGALELGTTALVVAFALAAAVIYAVRTQAIATGTGIGLLAGCAGVVIVAAIIGALRAVDDERVARRIDRASNLADRLSTAVAFDRVLTTDQTLDADGRDFMTAAIRDAARAVPRANVVAATPYREPRDLRAALGFGVAAAVVALLHIELPDTTARLVRAEPAFGAPGAKVTLHGKHLLTGVSHRPVSASLPDRPELALGAAGAPAAADNRVPTNVAVYLGTELDGDGRVKTAGIPMDITGWSRDKVGITIPHDAPLGKTTLTVLIADRPTNQVAFEVVDPKDTRYHPEDAAAMEEDELAYARDLLADLRQVADQDDVPELKDFAAKVQELLDQAERGEITKEKLLEKLAEAEAEMTKGQEPKQEEIDDALKETGKELEKSKITEELGKAMAEGNLDKAKEELEKLAEKLENGRLDDKQKEELAKAMEQAAEQFQKKEQERDDKQQKARENLEKEIRKLEKQKDQAKNDREREDMERRLEKKRRELEKLDKDQEEQEQSEQRRALKRLHRDMEKSAEDLQKKKDPNQSQQQQQEQEQEQEKQASRNLKDAAQETGKVSQDQRKQAGQKKVASQMEDLREAMRRAKRRGQRGAQDPFGRQGKQQDFISRARGQRGSGQAWKPGQGQQPGQGQGQNGQNGQQGGQGQQPGGQQWGTGTDPNLTGDATALSGNTSDQDLQGVQGKGSSKREVILAAAQKGFAGARYKDVYTDYKRIVEEVMRAEKVPSSYKYYLKRYFNKIKPHAMSSAESEPKEP